MASTARTPAGRVAPRRRLRGVLLASVLLASGLPPPALGAGFTPLGMPGSQLLALSRDGRVGAGSLVGASTGGFRWSDAHGIQSLPGAMSVRGVSASGRYVAGSSIDAEQREVASYWNADGELVRIGGLPGTAWQGGFVSVAAGISDEPRVVGVASSAEQGSAAFEWTAADGMRALPLPAEAKSAGAGGLSDDGRHVYGWIEATPGVRRGVLWRHDAPEPLVDAGGSPAGEVLGGNRDLTVLLGIGTADAGSVDAAYYWRAGTGARTTSAPVPLPSPQRLFVSDDGGRLLAGSAGSGANRVAVVWTAETGLQTLRAALAARGIAVPAGWTLAAATGVSGDGRRLGGWGQHDGHFDSFVVDLAATAPPIAATATATPRAD